MWLVYPQLLSMRHGTVPGLHKLQHHLSLALIPVPLAPALSRRSTCNVGVGKQNDGNAPKGGRGTTFLSVLSVKTVRLSLSLSHNCAGYDQRCGQPSATTTTDGSQRRPSMTCHAMRCDAICSDKEPDTSVHALHAYRHSFGHTYIRIRAMHSHSRSPSLSFRKSLVGDSWPVEGPW